jgi:hypothetical protein
MTKDNIIRMAREAGMAGMLTDVVTTFDELERFAALIREECAKICDRVEDELRDDDQVSAAGGAWRCGFEIRERGRDGQ